MVEESAGFNIRKFLFAKISRKLLFGTLIIALLVALVGVVSLYQLNAIAEPLEKNLPESVEAIAKTSHLDIVAHFIRYYDEVLTQSARNYAFTEDKKWKDRYEEVVPKLDERIKEAIEKGDETDIGFFTSVGKANIALVEMEETAIALVDEGRTDEAVAILESDEYWGQKEIYTRGLVNYVERRGTEYDDAVSASTAAFDLAIIHTRNLVDSGTQLVLIFIVIAFILAFVLSYPVSLSISRPIQQLQAATKELEGGNFKARVDIKTNDELEELGEAFNKTSEVLGRMDEERKQLDHAKTEFLSITSHELRSPMTPMKAQLQMLLEGYFGNLNEKQKKAAEIVLRNTSRLDNIIVDFLEISRIEAARLKFKFVKTNLAAPAKLLADEMKGFMPEKNIEIVLKIGKLPVIEVDPDRAMQVLRNLINNAKKFSPKNSKIVVSTELENNMIKFGVKDQGIGISVENQTQIFEPFYQAEQTMYDRKGGTGLGLAISRGIIESQNGKLWVESAEGKGSTFYFTVPLKPVREMKPIKVLFSQQEDVERKIEERFREALGPMGSVEFETLKKGGITEENLYKYVKYLFEKGILDEEKSGEFKKNLADVTKGYFTKKPQGKNKTQ